MTTQLFHIQVQVFVERLTKGFKLRRYAAAMSPIVRYQQMKKELKHIDRVNKQQVEFCRKLGIDVSGDTVSLATAKIYDIIRREFFAEELGRPSEKQIELAKKFGFDISHCSQREGNAIIDDLMSELNHESIEGQKLEPGVQVINRWDDLKRVYTISSIREDGIVFFKGGNGKKAWARNLERIESEHPA